MIKKIVHIAFITLLLSIILHAQTNIFVSPKGNDINPGTQAKPFASINRAITEARRTLGKVVIYLLEGTYYLNYPIVFTPEDSRKENETLTIRNFKNQKVIISGGIPLNLKWKKFKDGIWQTIIETNLIFDQLIVNGKLQHMARYPNYDSNARFLGGTSADALSKERVSGWKSPEGGYVHALHRNEWVIFITSSPGKKMRENLYLKEAGRTTAGWECMRLIAL